jgi:hypothetical protein
MKNSDDINLSISHENFIYFADIIKKHQDECFESIMDNLQIIKSNFDSKSQVNSKSNKRK